MTMTMTQKILARAAGLEEVKAGQFIIASLDRVLGNDITAPLAINEFQAMGATKLFDADKITLVMDHFTPNKDIKAAEQCKLCRSFASKMGIAGFYDGGSMGIEHVLLPELGLVTAGDVIIGADSHTCTYGALGAFSTGVGSTDMAVGMMTGKAWFQVPGAISVVLDGQLNDWVSGKDLILHLIGMIGVDGALYKSLEFSGPGIASLSMSDRFTICNMAIEAGAKNGIFPVDERTIAYLENAGVKPAVVLEADKDAFYERTITINLDTITPTVAFPHLPENLRSFEDGLAEGSEKVVIDQVVIGSCTNGRLEDLQVAAAILKGHKTAPDVRVIIIPGTQKTYLEAMEQGLLKVFIDAGALVSTPTCGPCLGSHMGILAAGERAVATTNRNFVGRMGHVDSEVYLASPAVAAASALYGYIADPRTVPGALDPRKASIKEGVQHGF